MGNGNIRFSGTIIRSESASSCLVPVCPGHLPLFKGFLLRFCLILVFSIGTGLCSCSTLSPVTVPAGRSGVSRAVSIEDLSPRWLPFAEDRIPGLGYFAGTVGKPRLEFWALRVDLGEADLAIVVSGQEPAEGGGAERPEAPEEIESAGLSPIGVIPSTRVSGFVKRYDCLAGINANPFSPVSAKIGEDRTIDGITIAGGRLISLPNPGFDALVFYREAEAEGGGFRAAIVNQAILEGEELRRITHAVGGFHIVLREGAVPGAVEKRSKARHPRSAAGLSPDGKTLYLLVVDGRRPGSIGVTEGELGIMLKRLGASEGLNFDGGGSTALALRYDDGKVRVVNTPIHRGIPGRERGVATCLGIAPETRP
ncbi:MAG: phosphodiester glycosidase family protein [Spirochaetaceae bacterium]|nr:phosphodiester glycosidase family protein [Spirochaetaceae bacterium]